MSTKNPTGRIAITLATTFGVQLRKHEDPTEPARDGLSVGEAREVAAQDPRLVFVSADDVAAAITTRQIRDLRAEAEAASDYAQVDLCDVALAAHETAGADGSDLVGPDGAPMTRTAARVECALAIADAAAQR